VSTEIAAGHPLAVGLHWTGVEVGHAMCITGYDDDSGMPNPIEKIDVLDPTAGYFILPFADFPSALYSGTTWTVTCFTQAPPLA
jgi:hypothetical protein